MSEKRQERQALKRKAQAGDYQATIALLDYELTKNTDTLIKSRINHDYHQGAVHALMTLRNLVV